MQVGIALQDTARLDIPALATRAEALGFESLWASEHVAYPVREDDVALPAGEFPDMAAILDPFIVLTAAAAVTRTLKLGTGVCLVPQRHALETAKAVASLDAISQGRFLFGVGAGWLREESDLFGVDFPRRWSQTRDHLMAMKAYWGAERASYAGPYVQFPEVWGYPRPVQQPHPPILVAGAAERVTERVAEYGDGWIPAAWRVEPEDVARRREEMVQAMAARGRDTAGFTVTLYAAKPDPERNRAFAEAGADRIVHFVPRGDMAQVLAELEKLAGKLL